MRTLPLLFLLLTACDPSAAAIGDPAGPADPADPNDPVDRDTFAEARAGRTCTTSLAGEPSITLGQLIDGAFEPLGAGAGLPVHAGGQGGYHSDLLVLMEGWGAEAPIANGLDLDVSMAPGDWSEGVVTHLNPTCLDLGFFGYFAPVRLFWWGPDGEITEEDYCGLDPCGEDGDSLQCTEYWDCLDDFEWGGGSPNISWGEVMDQTATLSASVVSEGYSSNATVTDVDLVEGEQEMGG